MFSKCLSKRNYTQLSETNVKNKTQECEKIDCLSCLIQELKCEKWQERSDEVFLKMAYEKKIIQNIPDSINKLNKEDKRSLKDILAMCYLEDYQL